MTVFTKRAVDVFAPYDADGKPRSVDNQDAQTWGMEVEYNVTALSEEIESDYATLSKAIDDIAAVSASGIQWKDPVRVAVASNVDLSSPGTSLDGVDLTNGDRFAVLGQTAAAQNGLYVWNGATSAASRAGDADDGDEILGAAFYVKEGTENAGTQWVCGTPAPITIGTTELAFRKIREQVGGVDELLDIFVSGRNLYDPNISGAVLTDNYNETGGSISHGVLKNFATSGKVPVTAGLTYSVTLTNAPPNWIIYHSIHFWDANGSHVGTVVAGSALAFKDGNKTITFTVPTGAVTVGWNYIYDYEVDPTSDDFDALLPLVMMNVGDKPMAFEAYNAGGYSPGDAFHVPGQDGTQRDPYEGKSLIVQRSGIAVFIRSRWSETYDLVQRVNVGVAESSTGSRYITPAGARLIHAWEDAENTMASYYLPVRQIANGTDEGPPVQINNMYVGGGHGPFAQQITAMGHGKTNVDVGSRWTDGAAKMWVLAAVVDINTLKVIPANTGTATSWVVSGSLTGSTLTHSNGATHTDAITFSAPVASQLHPFLQNYAYSIVIDKDYAIVEDGVYRTDTLTLSERYGIPNVASVIDYLVAKVGNVATPIYNNASIQRQIDINIGWKYSHGGACTVTYGLLNVQAYGRNYFGAIQASPLVTPADGALKVLVPGLDPFTQSSISYDFDAIQDMTDNAATVYAMAANWSDVSNPPARFIMLVDDANGKPLHGFVQGYSVRRGATKPEIRKDKVSVAWRISSVNKNYPYVEDNGAGAIAQAGDFREVVAYRAYFDTSAFVQESAKAIYNEGDKEILVLDLHTAFSNRWVELPERLVGQPISVVRKSDSLTLGSETIGPHGIMLSVTGGRGWLIAAIG